MAVYWAMFVTALVGVLFPARLRGDQARLLLAIAVISFGILVGLRHEVGGDWFNYEQKFHEVSLWAFTDVLIQSKDPAYYGIGWLISRLGGSVHLLNLVCAAPFAVGIYSLVKRQPLPWLALLAAVPYLIIVVGMGYTRQSAAIGFAMLGLVALSEHRVRRFAVLVLVGAAFHKSAVLLLPIAALSARRNRLWTSFWITIMALVGFWVFVSDAQDALWSSYVVSSYAGASQGAGVRVMMNTLPALLVLWKRRLLFAEETECVFWTWFASLALLCIPLLILSPTGADRIALYFIPLQLVVFGRITRLGSVVSTRTFLVLSACAYFASVQYVWLNFADHADAWIPYRISLLG